MLSSDSVLSTVSKSDGTVYEMLRTNLILANSVTDILLDLDTKSMKTIRQFFDRCGGSVSRKEFVDIIQTYVPKSEQFEETVSKLKELFIEIDINGDTLVSWEEFTSYIMKNAALPLKRRFQKNKKFVPCDVASEIKFPALEKIKYFPEMDRLVACDHSKIVKLFKITTTENQKQDYILTKELKAHSGTILNAEYIPDYNYLCTSSTDSTILFWEANGLFRMRNKEFIQAGNPQLSLAYETQHKILFSSSTRGIVHGWNIENCKEKLQFKGHTDIVTDLKLIKNTSILASAGFDSKILLWDVSTGEAYSTLVGHKKGVISLAYAPDHRLLFSASSDRDILVWNPVVEELVYKLKGHHSSLVGVDVIEGTTQIVSADIDGFFKIWDIRTFECMQTFPNPNPSMGLASFTTVPGYNQIVAGGKSLYSFQWDRPSKPNLTMNDPIEAVIYNDTSKTVLTAGGKDIKIWDTSNGQLIRTYSNVTDHKITSVCLDDRQRKIVIGNTKGQVQIVNYNNGLLLRDLSPHQSEVSGLVYANDKSVISSSWDSKVSIHNELLPHNKPSVVRVVSCNDKDVIYLTHAAELSLFACSDSTNTIRVWDFDTCLPELQIKMENEITFLLLANIYPILFLSDNSSQVLIYTLRPFIKKNQLLQKFNTKTSENEDLGIVHFMVFSSGNRLLITGDEKGDIKVWNLNELFEKHSIKPVQKNKKSNGNGYNNFKIPIQQESSEVSLIYEWHAHSGPITSIYLIRDDEYLFTGSTDCLVKIWNLQGDCFGTLCHSTPIKWTLPEPLQIEKHIEDSGDTSSSEEIESPNVLEHIKTIKRRLNRSSRQRTEKSTQIEKETYINVLLSLGDPPLPVIRNSPIISPNKIAIPSAPVQLPLVKRKRIRNQSDSSFTQKQLELADRLNQALSKIS